MGRGQRQSGECLTGQGGTSRPASKGPLERGAVQERGGGGARGVKPGPPPLLCRLPRCFLAFGLLGCSGRLCRPAERGRVSAVEAHLLWGGDTLRRGPGPCSEPASGPHTCTRLPDGPCHVSQATVAIRPVCRALRTPTRAAATLAHLAHTGWQVQPGVAHCLRLSAGLALGRRQPHF